MQQYMIIYESLFSLKFHAHSLSLLMNSQSHHIKVLLEVEVEVEVEVVKRGFCINMFG